MCEPAPLSPTCRLGLEPMLPLYNFRTNKKLLFNLYRPTVPMLIKLELKTTLVLGLYKLVVLAIVAYVCYRLHKYYPPPSRFTNAQLLQEKE